jgi:hypothetical protein
LEERKSGTSDEAAETLSLLSLLRKQLLDADDSRAIGFAVADAIAAAPVLNELLAGVRTAVQIKRQQLGLPGGWLAATCMFSVSFFSLPGG